MDCSLILRNTTNLSEARFAAAEGFDLVSFSLDPNSETFVSYDTIREICGWLSGPRVSAFFPNWIPSLIEDAVAALSLDSVELPWSKDLVPHWKNIPLIPHLNESQFIENISILESFDMVILHLSQEELSPELVLSLENFKSICALDFSWNISTLETIHIKYKPTAIVFSGSKEEKVGLHDFDVIADCLDLIRLD